jgi:hypothetical protein
MILFAVSLASAAVTITPTAVFPTTLNNSQLYTFNFNVSTNETDMTLISFDATPNSAIAYSWTKPVSVLLNSTNRTVQVGYTLSISSAITGSETFTFTASNGSMVNSSSFTATIQNKPTASTSGNVNLTKMCTYGINGTDLLSVSDIEDKSGLDDDWNWQSLDDVTVRVTIENNGAKDNEDYKVQLYFFDDTGKDVSSKFVDDTDSLKQEINNLDSGDDSDLDFSFKLSTDVDSGDYRMFVKAYRSSQEKAQCVVLEGETQISIDQDDDYAIVSDIVAPVTASCGDNVEITATVSNTGSNDQDRVKVILYNKDLGLNMFREIDNMDSGDETDVTFSFAISPSVAEKLYRLTFSTEFNYDDHDESYDDQSDSEDDYVYSLSVAGGCNDPTKPTLSARLNSTAIVDENLVVEVSLKNNANSSLSAIVAPESYDSWAELVSVNPSTITVSKQNTGKVYVTLKPTQSGQQTFNLNVVYNGKTIDQPVTVNVNAGSEGWLSSLYSQFGKTGTYLLMGIVLLVVVIILILIVRAIRANNN